MFCKISDKALSLMLIVKNIKSNAKSRKNLNLFQQMFLLNLIKKTFSDFLDTNSQTSTKTWAKVTTDNMA